MDVQMKSVVARDMLFSFSFYSYQCDSDFDELEICRRHLGERKREHWNGQWNPRKWDSCEANIIYSIWFA